MNQFNIDLELGNLSVGKEIPVDTLRQLAEYLGTRVHVLQDGIVSLENDISDLNNELELVEGQLYEVEEELNYIKKASA